MCMWWWREGGGGGLYHALDERELLLMLGPDDSRSSAHCECHTHGCANCASRIMLLTRDVTSNMISMVYFVSHTQLDDSTMNKLHEASAI